VCLPFGNPSSSDKAKGKEKQVWTIVLVPKSWDKTRQDFTQFLYELVRVLDWYLSASIEINTRRVMKLNFLAFWESYTRKKGKTVSFFLCPPPYQLVPWTRNPAGEDLLLYHVSLIFLFILLLLQCFTKLFLKCWGVEWVLECFSLLCAASGDGVTKWKTPLAGKRNT
jgi:hypothetical protein